MRYTGDIDFWVKASPENAERILTALQAFGFGGLRLKSEDFTSTSQVIQLGYPPNRIDLITGLEGMDFDECYSTKEEVEVGEGVHCRYIDFENLIKAKKIAGRDKDLLDIKNLQ